MDWILLGKALVLGVVEGLTEFLPISSTGHLILVGDLLGFSDEKAKVFEIVIQCGAILAICWEYRAKFWSVIVNLPTQRNAQRFAFNLLVAFVPIAVLAVRSVFEERFLKHALRGYKAYTEKVRYRLIPFVW